MSDRDNEKQAGEMIDEPAPAMDLRAWEADITARIQDVAGFVPFPLDASYGERVAHLIRMAAKVAALQHSVALASLYPAEPEEQARDMAWASAQGLWQGGWPVN